MYIENSIEYCVVYSAGISVIMAFKVKILLVNILRFDE